MYGTQTCVLGRQPSTTRNVDHQAMLALVAAELHKLAVDGFHFEIMEPGHVSPLLLQSPCLKSKPGYEDTRTSAPSGHARTFAAKALPEQSVMAETLRAWRSEADSP